MVLNCVAYNCYNLHDKRNAISFHTFPFKRPEILELWVKAVRRENWAPSKSSRLCSAHFLPSDYLEKPGCTAKILKLDAVPSIFSFPKHLMKTLALPRRKLVKHLPNDMENYMQYHDMGSVSQVRMKPGCSPTKFECQSDRKKRTAKARRRPYVVKNQRKALIEECEAYLEDTDSSTKHLELGETSSGSKAVEPSLISCKLCFKTTSDTNFVPVSRTALDNLEFLQINVHPSEESEFVCKQCEQRIQNVFNFKSRVVNTECDLLSYISKENMQKINLKELMGKYCPGTSRKATTEKDVCRFCKEFVDPMAMISLSKIFKDDLIEDLFPGHLPEIDLELTENPLVCDTCQKCLVSFSTLVTCWSASNSFTNDNKMEDMPEDSKYTFKLMDIKNEDVSDFSEPTIEESNKSLQISESVQSEQTVLLNTISEADERLERERTVSNSVNTNIINSVVILQNSDQFFTIKTEPSDIRDNENLHLLNNAPPIENCDILSDHLQLKQEDVTIYHFVDFETSQFVEISDTIIIKKESEEISVSNESVQMLNKQ